MIKSAVKPIQNASKIVAIPGFCFNGIHSSSEISEVNIPAWPYVILIVLDMPSCNTPHGPNQRFAI